MATDLLRDISSKKSAQSDRTDVELGAARGMGSEGRAADPRLEQFLADVADAKLRVEAMKGLLRSLEEQQQQSLRVTRAKDVKQVKEHMEKDAAAVLRVAKELKGRIEALESENKESRLQRGCEEGTFTDRTRVNMTNNLKRRLRETLDRFQELRAESQKQYKETVERRYYTVTGSKPDRDTVDRLAATGDGEAIFQKAIQEQGRGQVIDAIAEVQERFEAVQEIEGQLKELHQLFLDMAVMVEAQGELVDNIEMNVLDARDHVAQANIQLGKARKLQLNSRKWTLIGGTIILVALLILILIILKIAGVI